MKRFLIRLGQFLLGVLVFIIGATVFVYLTTSPADWSSKVMAYVCAVVVMGLGLKMMQSW